MLIEGNLARSGSIGKAPEVPRSVKSTTNFYIWFPRSPNQFSAIQKPWGTVGLPEKLDTERISVFRRGQEEMDMILVRKIPVRMFLKAQFGLFLGVVNEDAFLRVTRCVAFGRGVVRVTRPLTTRVV